MECGGYKMRPKDKIKMIELMEEYAAERSRCANNCGEVIKEMEELIDDLASKNVAKEESY
jgi:hypothetical protein